MGQFNYLNIGCGTKFHKDWYNVDLISNSPYVMKWDLIKGIPFPDNKFDVVYHSQVLEHISKEKAPNLIKECFRVLKPGGIMRIVLPDLENIVEEYRKYLHENINNPTKLSEANYDWILLEMYDQVVRTYSGGQMRVFLKQPELINEDYIVDRIGYVGLKYKEERKLKMREDYKIKLNFIKRQKKRIKYILKLIKDTCYTERYKMGKFRLSGEVHMWMYDRFSLSRLLENNGFTNTKVMNPFDSDIPDWNIFELDVKDGMVYDPTSLFMEATKPE